MLNPTQLTEADHLLPEAQVREFAVDSEALRSMEYFSACYEKAEEKIRGEMRDLQAEKKTRFHTEAHAVFVANSAAESLAAVYFPGETFSSVLEKYKSGMYAGNDLTNARNAEKIMTFRLIALGHDLKQEYEIPPNDLTAKRSMATQNELESGVDTFNILNEFKYTGAEPGYEKDEPVFGVPLSDIAFIYEATYPGFSVTNIGIDALGRARHALDVRQPAVYKIIERNKEGLSDVELAAFATAIGDLSEVSGGRPLDEALGTAAALFREGRANFTERVEADPKIVADPEVVKLYPLIVKDILFFFEIQPAFIESQKKHFEDYIGFLLGRLGESDKQAAESLLSWSGKFNKFDENAEGVDKFFGNLCAKHSRLIASVCLDESAPEAVKKYVQESVFTAQALEKAQEDLNTNPMTDKEKIQAFSTLLQDIGYKLK